MGLSKRGGMVSWPAGGSGGSPSSPSWLRTEYAVEASLFSPVTPQTPASSLWTAFNQIMFRLEIDASGPATIEIDSSIENGRWLVGVLPYGFLSLTFAQGAFTTEIPITPDGHVYWLVLDEAQGLSISPVEQSFDVQRFEDASIWSRRAPVTTLLCDPDAGAFALQLDVAAVTDGDQVAIVDSTGGASTKPITVTAVQVLTYSVTKTWEELAAPESPTLEFAVPEMDGLNFISITMSGTPFAGASGAITAGVRTNGGAFYFPATDASDGVWSGEDIVENVGTTIAEPTLRFEIAGGGNFDATSGEVTFTFSYYESGGTINGAADYVIDDDRGWVVLVWDEETTNWCIVSEDAPPPAEVAGDLLQYPSDSTQGYTRAATFQTTLAATTGNCGSFVMPALGGVIDAVCTVVIVKSDGAAAYKQDVEAAFIISGAGLATQMSTNTSSTAKTSGTTTGISLSLASDGASPSTISMAVTVPAGTWSVTVSWSLVYRTVTA